MTIVRLDKTGHTVLDQDLDTAWKDLTGKGYAMFLDEQQLDRNTPPDFTQPGEILALAPLVGG